MTTVLESAAFGSAAAVSPSAAARQLLAKHWDGSLPVDPFKLAKLEGLTVRCRGMFDDEPYPYSGHFLRTQGVIEFNGDEAPVRQRFTMAHELGHYALGHEDAPRDSVASFNSRQNSPMERAANQFAAELLMPAKAVATLVQSGKFKTVDDLAKAFDVSKVAMTYRINNLGLPV